MTWVKKLWFPVAATLLVGVVGYNLYTVARLRQSNDAGNGNAASQGSGSRGSSTRSGSAVSVSARLVSTPGPHDIVLRVKTQNADIDAEKLTRALETLGPVEKAVIDGTSVQLTISGPLNLSELVERLGVQELHVVEDELPLSGGLRLHASGMT